MKYTLVTFFFLFSLAVCSQDIRTIYYISNNTLLELSNNRFVLKTGIEDGEIVSWSKKFLSVEEVIKRLRKFH